MSRKRSVSFLILVSFVLTFVSCGKEDPHPYSHCEMAIPLSDDFYLTENENFDVTYTNGIAMAAVLRISFQAASLSSIPHTFTARQFGSYWLYKTENDAELLYHGNLSYANYSKDGIYYISAFYVSKYAYFVLLFAVDDDLSDEWHDKFLAFASEVYFTE